MKNLILYFSATGNTARLVGIVESELRSSGQEFATAIISPDGTVPDCAGLDRLIVAFPVLAMMPPVFVQRFLRRLPRGDAGGTRTTAAILAATGGGGYSAVPRAAAMLRRRGYDVAFGAEAAYAENWTELGGVPPDADTAAAKTEAGDNRAREIAAALVRGDRSMYRPGAAGSIFGTLLALLFGVFGRRFLGKLLVADERCTSCGLCARTCPVNAIIMEKGRRARPFWRMNCENCNRCINVCPVEAINTSILNIVLQFTTIGILLALGIKAVDRFAWPWMKPVIPASAGALVHGVLVAIAVLAAHAISIGPADFFIYRWMRRIPGLRRAFGLSFSRGFRRYLAPGFRPSAK